MWDNRIVGPGAQNLGDAIENNAEVSFYYGKMRNSVFEMLDFVCQREI